MPAPVAAGAVSPWAVLDDAREIERFTTTTTASCGSGGGAGAEASSYLRIAGMHCAACASAVEAALLRVDGVREVQVSVSAQTARVRWSPAQGRPSAFVAALRQAGYDAVPDTASAARDLRRRERRDAL